MFWYEQKNTVDLVILSGFNQVGFTEKKEIVDLVILLVLTNLVLPWLYHSKIF